jgi:Arc/MetJ-type ribon-helix-helix transcriptional regulator
VRNIIVSVRMPRSMADELHLLAKKNHFLDVSEEIRTIIREKTAAYSQPYSLEVKKIITDIRGEISSKEQEKKKLLVTNLKKLLEEFDA